MTDAMQGKARDASLFLKALANPNRLMILCQLADGEKSVGQLEALLGVRQPTLSQQLARLRREQFVKTRRNAKNVYYSLTSGEVRRVIELLYALFCAPASRPKAPRPAAKRASGRGQRTAAPRP